MVLDGLRARLDQLLAGASDPRAFTDGLYAAMVDTKSAIAAIRDARTTTERELTRERQQLADAERRGTLASQIGDTETAELAEVWTGKHRARVDLLERKLAVQLDELAMAERQLEEMKEHYQKARRGIPPGGPAVPDPGAAEPVDPAVYELERKARRDQVQDQLADLKRRMGKDS